MRPNLGLITPEAKKRQAEATRRAIKSYGRNVVGGAKIVGSAVKKGALSGEQMLKKAVKKLIRS